MSSLEMDLWTELCFDEDNGDVETHLSREAVISESYNGSFKRAHGYKWGESLTFSVTFIKQNYEEFTEQENRKVLKWLTSLPNASFVDIYMDDSEVISWSALGNWINISQYKLANGRIAGYVAEFEAVTPWAFSALQTITKDVSDPTDDKNKIIIDIETDEPQSAIYPRITIRQDSNTNIIEVKQPMTDADNWVQGSVFHYNDTYYWIDSEGKKHESTENTSDIETTSVSIKNTYTDDNGNVKTFDALVKNNIKGETVVLDGANRVVSSSTENRIFGDNFSWDWIPLYEGKNELSFVGNCTVTVEYREVRKVGEF